MSRGWFDIKYQNLISKLHFLNQFSSGQRSSIRYHFYRSFSNFLVFQRLPTFDCPVHFLRYLLHVAVLLFVF